MEEERKDVVVKLDPIPFSPKVNRAGEVPAPRGADNILIFVKKEEEDEE